jgi:hypothetical protein
MKCNSYSTINAGVSQTVRTLVNEGAIIAAVARETCRNSCGITREVGQFRPRILEVRLDDQLDPYHYSRRAILFPDDRPSHVLYV